MTRSFAIRLAGKKFRDLSTSSAGAADDHTLFEFHEKAAVAYARYVGGSIRIGFLVGAFSDERLRLRYVQIDHAGRVYSGHSVCDLERTVGGSTSPA